MRLTLESYTIVNIARRLEIGGGAALDNNDPLHSIRCSIMPRIIYEMQAYRFYRTITIPRRDQCVIRDLYALDLHLEGYRRLMRAMNLQVLGPQRSHDSS